MARPKRRFVLLEFILAKTTSLKIGLQLNDESVSKALREKLLSSFGPIIAAQSQLRTLHAVVGSSAPACSAGAAPPDAGAPSSAPASGGAASGAAAGGGSSVRPTAGSLSLLVLVQCATAHVERVLLASSEIRALGVVSGVGVMSGSKKRRRKADEDEEDGGSLSDEEMLGGGRIGDDVMSLGSSAAASARVLPRTVAVSGQRKLILDRYAAEHRGRGGTVDGRAAGETETQSVASMAEWEAGMRASVLSGGGPA